MAALIWLVLMVGAFYFLLWRPQQRRAQGLRALQDSIAADDEIVTTSGIFGRVLAADGEVLEVEVAPGTVIRLARGAVGQRLGDEIDPDPDSDAAEGT